MRTHLALTLALLTTAVAAQRFPGEHKLDGYLAHRLRHAKEGERIKTYFVMGDRLGWRHWFPRLNRLDADARRRVVIAELQAHAARTQARLLDKVRGGRMRRQCDCLHVNWLGNFVVVSAAPEFVREAAAVDDVAEVWADATVAHVEDFAPPPAQCPAGNGPLDVGADRVWKMGFTGLDVLVMNADSGINVQHVALENRLWWNPGEVPGNRIDDDANGFVDDVNGWDFGGNTNNLDDNGSHGTATAGVLVADCSCGGITYGVAPDGLVMTGKLLTEVDQWEAIQYAIQMGAHVQTSSHSYKNDFIPPPNYRMHRDVADASLAAGLIRFNSTSNNGALCNDPTQVVRKPFNISVPGNVPPPYLDPAQTLIGRKSGVIGVGAYTVGTATLDPQTQCGPAAWHLSDLLAVLPSYPLANWDPIKHNDYPWFNGTQLALLKPDVLGPTGTLTSVGAGRTCLIRPFGGTSNATPIAAGCAMLWKSANFSLKPEDVAMILHQTSRDGGLVPGKENTWGAGRIDAYAGALLALCVHRVNGEPAWEVVHRGGTPVRLELDGSENKPALIAVGLSRSTFNFGIVTSGIGGTMLGLWGGSTGASGTVAVDVPVAPFAAPLTVYTQAFIDDRAGPSGKVLASNVIALKIVP